MIWFCSGESNSTPMKGSISDTLSNNHIGLGPILLCIIFNVSDYQTFGTLIKLVKSLSMLKILEFSCKIDMFSVSREYGLMLLYK